MTDGVGGAAGAGAAIHSAVGTASGSGADVSFVYDPSTTIPSRIVTVAADNRVAVITRIRETATWRS
jgi:hypothetical protein